LGLSAAHQCHNGGQNYRFVHDTGKFRLTPE